MVFAPGLQRAETVPEMVERLSMPIPEAGCYAWLGGHSRGYAKMQWRENGRRWSARVAHYLCEPVPDGLEVDHLCRMRWCVNPDHLELITHRENIQRQRAYAVATRQFCEKHPDIRLTREGKVRVCRICRREYQRQRYARRKENRFGPEP